jgi:hypothetical protein
MKIKATRVLFNEETGKTRKRIPLDAWTCENERNKVVEIQLDYGDSVYVDMKDLQKFFSLYNDS